MSQSENSPQGNNTPPTHFVTDEEESTGPYIVERVSAIVLLIYNELEQALPFISNGFFWEGFPIIADHNPKIYFQSFRVGPYLFDTKIQTNAYNLSLITFG
ncbi:hypothetical protein BB560_005894 [Smittium megazygosporum]|uniref:Uncharacterized protein n=1 Tax=Smittium megazygosporum TaxID=133381 RepID=A0A2T9YRX2_9FUNG|nr:hypothetical protein BB560_005894 [Smittium megazygosporum]